MGKGGGRLQRSELASESELVLGQKLIVSQELSPEDQTEYFDREKELRRAGNSAAMIGLESSSRDHAMQVGMRSSIGGSLPFAMNTGPKDRCKSSWLRKIGFCCQQKKRVLRFEAGEIRDNCELVAAEYENGEYTDASVSAEQRSFAFVAAVRSEICAALRDRARVSHEPALLVCRHSGVRRVQIRFGGSVSLLLTETVDTAETRSCIKSLLLRSLRERLGPLTEAMKQEDEALDRLQAAVSVPPGPALDSDFAL